MNINLHQVTDIKINTIKLDSGPVLLSMFLQTKKFPDMHSCPELNLFFQDDNDYHTFVLSIVKHFCKG